MNYSGKYSCEDIFTCLTTNVFKSISSSFLVMMLIVMLLPSEAFSNAWPGANLRSTASPLCNSNRAVGGIGPGDYVQFYVYNTAQYYFNNCQTGNWDTDLSIYRTSNGAQLAYTDAGIGGCAYSMVRNYNWTSNYTGTVRVIQPKYFNQGSSTSWGWTGGLSSATLYYRQVKNFNIHSSVGNNLCSNTNRTLSVTGNGTGGYWTKISGGGTVSGNTYYPQGTTGSVTVRYTLGACYEDKAFTVISTSSTPSGISGTSTICNGQTTTLTVTGGSLGSGASWRWYSGSCGGTYLGSGNSINVSPSSTTFYYVRAEGTCNTTNCSYLQVTVRQLSTAPSGVTGTNVICKGQSTVLSVSGGSLGYGANWNWYSSSCGGTSVGTGASISVSPNSTTTYYVRAEGSCNTTSCASRTVTVRTLSTSASSISGVTAICQGTSTTLTRSGGSLGTGGTWQWYSGSCGGASLGSGNSITVSPSSTTTYYLRAEGTCNTTGCVSATVSVSPQPVAQSISKSPNLASVCDGQSVSASFSGGSGGVGCSNVYQYRVRPAGGSFTSWISYPPGSSFSTAGFDRVEIRTLRTNCTGSAGCSQDVNTVAWDVTPQPEAQGITKIPNETSICQGQAVKGSFTPGSGGVGCIDQIFYRTKPMGGFYGPWLFYFNFPGFQINTFGLEEVQIRTLRTNCTPGSGCNGDENIVTWTVVPQSTVSITGGGEICPYENFSFTATANNGTGTCSFQWQESPNGSSGWTNVGSNSASFNSGSIATTKYYRVLYSCTGAGCFTSTSNVSQVLVRDIEDPVISGCPSGQSLSSQAGQCGSIASWTAPTVADNCSIVSFTSNYASGDFFPVGSTTVTYTATDIGGNTSTCSFTISVSDVEAPAISSMPANITQGSDLGDCGALVSWAAPSSSDNCAVTSFTSTYASGDFFPVGTTTVTYTAEDAAGNSTSASFDVTVQDTEAPTTVCTDVSIQLDGIGFASITVADIDGGSTDNCGILSVTLDQTTFGCGDTGVNVVQLTVTDIHGNVSTCNANVTVNDFIPPGITCQDFLGNPNDAGQCGGTVSIPSPGLTSNCGIASLVNDYNGTSDASDFYPVGTTDVTYTVTDYSNNSSTCTFTVEVLDVEAPTFTVPADMFRPTDPGLCTANLTVAQPTNVADNCAVASVVNDKTGTDNASGVYAEGFTIVKWTVTDIYGNSYSQDQFILVVDDEDPAITCASNITITAEPGVCEAYVSVPQPTVSDNCGIDYFINITVTGTNNASAVYPVGTTEIIWKVHDINGNTSTCSQFVTVTDDENPVISGMPADITQASDFGFCGAVVTWAAPTSSDNCLVTSFTSTYAPGDYFPVGTTTVTYTAEDAAGNTTSASFDITVEDVEAPVITGTPSNITQASDFGFCGAVVTWTAPTSSDNCAVTSFTSTYVPGDYFPVGTTTVTYTSVDAAGNTTSTSFDITIEDVEAPVISGTPADITQDSDFGFCGAVVTWTAPTSSDNCAVTSFTSTYVPGDYFPVGTTTVTYTSVDAAGNTTSTSFDITIEDVEAPVISGTPADITQDSDFGFCGAVVTWTAPTSSDNCAVTSFTSTHSPGDYFETGKTTVTYTSVDAAGNTTSTSFDITILDVEAPVITGTPLDITQNSDLGYCGAVVTWVAPTSSDNCGVSSFTSTHNPGDFFETGTTTVTYTAEDTSGNTTSTSFDITILDVEAPVITGCPADISVIADSNDCTPSISWIAPTSSDNCGVSSFTSTHNPGDNFPVGTTTVTYTAEDTSGNVTTCSFNVVIQPKPLVLSTSVSVYNCGSNVSCFGASDGSSTVSVAGGCLPYSYAWSNGQSNATATGLSAGYYSVTVTDANGTTVATSVQLDQPDQMFGFTTPYVYPSGDNISCYGASDGSISLTVSGGAECLSYSFNWVGLGAAAGFSSTSQNIANLGPGTYFVQVTDANGCSFTTGAVLTEPTPLSVDFIGSPTFTGGNNISCNGANDGAILLTISGGSPAYTYAWTGPNGYTSTDQGPTGLAAGTYDVTVTDVNGCTISSSITLTEPDELISTLCPGQNVAYGYYPANVALVSGEVIGGIQPYTYEWSTGETSPEIMVAPTWTTTYTVTVTDVNGCFAIDSHTVTVIDIRCPQQKLVEMCNDKGKTRCVNVSTVADHLAAGWTIGACGSNFDPGTCGDPLTPGCECVGDLIGMRLEYSGASGVDINVYASSSQTTLLASYTNVQDGDFIQIAGSSLPSGKLNNTTYVEIVGEGTTIIESGCQPSNQPLISQTFGAFTVVEYLDEAYNHCIQGAESCADECDGDLKVMEVIYRGPSGVDINVYDSYSNGVSIAFQSFTNVQQGDILLVNGTLNNGNTMSPLTRFEVSGTPGPDAEIPTSCKDNDLIGKVYGQFEVLAYSDLKDNACNMEAPCPCKGQMALVGISYQGVAGGTVIAYSQQSTGNGNGSGNLSYDTLGVFENLQPGDSITVSGANGGTLDSYTYFEVSGVQGMIEINTSCSEYIQNTTFGDVLTVFGYVDGQDNYCNMPPPPPCDCEVGITELDLAYDYFDGSSLNNAHLIFYAGPGRQDTITEMTGVSFGDVITLDASGLPGGVFPATGVYVEIVGVNRFDVWLPAYCGSGLVGDLYAEFFVLSYTDGVGNVCEAPCGVGKTQMCHTPGNSGNTKVVCVDNSDVNTLLQNASWSLGPCTSAKRSEEQPTAGLQINEEGFELKAYPNPFTTSTTISFKFAKAERVDLKVYSVTGMEVAHLFDGNIDADKVYKVNFDGSNHTDGMYFFRLTTTEGETHTGKLILTK